MNVLFTILMYILWAFSLGGLLLLFFTGFQYVDLNILVLVLFFFAALNTFLKIKIK